MSTVRERYDLRAVAPFLIKGAEVKAQEIFPIASQELIGIEVEVENVVALLHNPISAWNTTTDGSLRNNGREFISKPIPANVAPFALYKLLDEALPKTASFSPRTSIHVHLNVQDLTLDQLHMLVLVYILYEKALFDFVGKNRARNIYCVPIHTTLLPYNFLKNGVEAQWSKYTGFNLRPVRDKGTVEFRHMHGTFDVQKICIWISLITKLKEFVKTIPPDELRKQLRELSLMDVPAFMTGVFGEYAKHLKYNSSMDFHNCFLTMTYCLQDYKVFRNFSSKISDNGFFFKVK